MTDPAMREAADYVANVVERISRHVQYGLDDPADHDPDTLCREMTDTQKRAAMTCLEVLRRMAREVDAMFAAVDPVLEPLPEHDCPEWSVSVV